MLRIMGMCLLLTLGAVAFAAQDINLSGTVKDGTGAAIAGASVTLASDTTMKATTNDKGEFLITTVIAVNHGPVFGTIDPALSSISFKGNTLRFSIASPAGNGMVTFFSGNGKKVAAFILGKMDAGVQTLALPGLAAGYYIMNITVDQRTTTIKLVNTGNEIFTGNYNSAIGGATMISHQAAATVTDTLVVTKTGFATVKKTIESYTQTGIAITMQPEGSANKDNLFASILGKTEAETDARLEEAFQQLFYGDKDNEAIYFEGGQGAYIYDYHDKDVRSEGQSYGMMITVQMNKKEEFEKIWKWTKQVMGKGQAGTFGWKASTGGSVTDQGSAPDGEEYIAAALIFAGKRWNNESYTQDGKSVCGAMKSFFNDGIIKFVASASFNDPSYILPAFYEVFAEVDNANQSFWKGAASKGRNFLKQVCHPTTMLGPYMANFDGSAYTQEWNGTPGNIYRDDSWRICLNIMLDWRFYQADSWQKDSFAPKHAAFMKTKYKAPYPEKMNLDGTVYNGAEWPDPCKGLVAPLGMLAFAIPEDENAKFFVQTLWDMETPTGEYRYYDGLLYMMSLLHVSGRTQLYH